MGQVCQLIGRSTVDPSRAWLPTRLWNITELNQNPDEIKLNHRVTFWVVAVDRGNAVSSA
jgi:hypothetical protein